MEYMCCMCSSQLVLMTRKSQCLVSKLTWSFFFLLLIFMHLQSNLKLTISPVFPTSSAPITIILKRSGFGVCPSLRCKFLRAVFILPAMLFTVVLRKVKLEDLVSSFIVNSIPENTLVYTIRLAFNKKHFYYYLLFHTL